MNIALFASDYYPSVGGVQEVVRQTALALQRGGDRAVVFTNRWPKDLPASEILDGIDVRRHIFRVPGETLKQRLGTWVTGPTTLASICSQLREAQIDLIHVHCVSSNAYYAIRAARRLKLPLVLTIHGELSMDSSDLFNRSAFARSNLRNAIESASAITACSKEALAEAERFYGQSFGQRGRVVYSGVRVNDFANVTPYQHKRPYILAIGRLAIQKGFDVLLNAFAKVLKEDDSHDLILAGDGPEQQKLHAMAGDLGIADRVCFFGPATRPVAVQLFAGAGMVVMPSRREAMGIVNLEAMAAGRAVISTRVGGVPEVVVDGQSGVLVEPESVDELAHEMLVLLRDPVLRRYLGDHGRERAMEFDWTRINDHFRRIYTDLLKSRSANGTVAVGALL